MIWVDATNMTTTSGHTLLSTSMKRCSKTQSERVRIKVRLKTIRKISKTKLFLISELELEFCRSLQPKQVPNMSMQLNTLK